MTLFFSLLPLYLFGNLHCFGMCGPLVLLIGQHRYRAYYLFGRLASFALAGLLAGGLGAVLHVFLKMYHLAELISLVFGFVFLFVGLKMLSGWVLPPAWPLQRLSQALNPWLSRHMLQDTKQSTFLFGFLTVALPCGQSLLVFSACALAGDALVGFSNGFAFALLTSPSLMIAMRTHLFFKKFRHHDKTVLGISALLVGGLTLCRGLAEMGWISHWILNPDAPNAYHIVIF